MTTSFLGDRRPLHPHLCMTLQFQLEYYLIPELHYLIIWARYKTESTKGSFISHVIIYSENCSRTDGKSHPRGHSLLWEITPNQPRFKCKLKPKGPTPSGDNKRPEVLGKVIHLFILLEFISTPRPRSFSGRKKDPRAPKRHSSSPPQGKPRNHRDVAS